MYKSPGIKIETNVQYPTTDGERTREIDILLTVNLEGLRVEYAFQCKNEAKPLDVNKLGEFVGALKDIGVPTKYGIFVSVNGFTSGAIAYAKKFGIQTLVLKGLSRDRLRSEISSAIQHNIYLVPRVEEFTVQNEAGAAEYDWQFFIFTDENKQMVGTVTDLIFNKWRNNEIPDQIGEHTFEMEIPQGWLQFYKGEKIEPQKITARITILAAVITIDGSAENFHLFNAETRKMEKFNAQVKFRQFQKGEVVPLQVFAAEQELSDFIEKSGNIRLTVKTKLLRIIVGDSYYPLSRHVAEVVFGQMQKYGLDFSQITQEQVREEIIKASENDMFREGTFSLIGKEMPVICTDNDGETVDASLLFNKGEFDKVIALREKFLTNPSKQFGSLIAWAYIEKSRQLFKKSYDKPETQRNRLLEESMAKAESALQVEPGFIPAYEHFSTISFARKEYSEALRVLDYILKREPERVHLWLNRAKAFMELKEWNSALESVDKAKSLEERREIKTEHFLMVLLRRANVLYRLKRYEETWQEILNAWKTEPDAAVKILADSRLIDEIADKVPNIEGILLLVEILYFRAAELIKQEQSAAAAYETAEEAVTILNSLMLAEQMKGEPIVIGQLSGALLEDTIRRILKRLRETGSIDLATEHIEKIKIWFRRTHEEDPDFLETVG